MKRVLLFATILLQLSVQAQDATVKEMKQNAQRVVTKNPEDTIPKTWKTGGFFAANIAQGSLSNWAAGGDKFSLAINGNLNVYGFFKKGKHSWDNVLDMHLAYMNTTSLGTRKNDDRIDLLSKYGYAIAPKWNVGALFNFRSQMLKGYSYDDNGNKTFNSSFLSPGYVLLSPGIEYKPNNNFSLFISPVTTRLTVVMDDTLSAKGAYGVAPGKHLKAEFGAFASANYFKEFNKMLSFRSRLDLYSNYLSRPQNIDVYWVNMLNMSLNKYLSINYSLDMIYDDDVRLFGPTKSSPAAQIKSMLGVGLMVKF